MTEQIAHQVLITVDFDQSHVSIGEHAKALLLAGQYTACLDFLHTQPSDLVDASPHLLIYQAAAMLFSEYSQQSIEAILAKAEQRIDSENFAGEISAIRAIICSYTGDPEMGIKLSKIALQKIEPGNTFFQNIIERNLGVAYTIKNDLRNANKWFEKLLMSSYQLQDWGGVLAAYNYLTYIRKVQGRLREADIIYRKALEFISDFGLEQMPHSIKIISGYGQLLLYWNQTTEAKAYFQKAIQLASETDILYAHTAYHNLCETYVRENDPHAAHAALDELRHHGQGKEELYGKIHLQHSKAIETRVQIEEGNLDHGTDWLISSGFEALSPNELFDHYGYELGLILPIAARIYILEGMYDRAITILKAVIPRLIHQGANSYLIRAFCALAIAYDQKGQPQRATNAISKAIALGKPENNIGDFLYFGRSLYPVINQAIHCGISSDYTLILLTHLKVFYPCAKKTVKNNREMASLSQREIDVLQLIAEGMTNRQIAMALYLSNNTIKSHSINIYRKLNVENRNQAVSQARLLGILPAKHQNLRVDVVM